MPKFLATICLAVWMPLTAQAGRATRADLTFPGYRAGEVMPKEAALHWVGWLRDRDFDVAGFVRDQATVELILRDDDSLDALVHAGFRVIERELPTADQPSLRGSLSDYANPTEVRDFLLATVAEHPTLAAMTVIGTTHEGRDIYALEISNNPGVPEDEPAILLNGLHHAREVVTPHVVMDAITYLTDRYSAGDPQVMNWVDHFKVFCVPMVNPDGSNYVHTAEPNHRKNMAPVCTGGNLGVDLNRNYPYHWGAGVANCERGTGSSGNTCSDTYRGGSAASELETQAMIGLAQQERFLVAVSYHSAGRFIDYPYACNDGNPDNRMPEHAIIDEIMHGTADGIAAVGGVTYDVYSPIAIGPVNGDDTSWYYAHNGTYPLIIEIGTSFQPPFATGMAEVARNRGGWLYLLGRMGGARLDVRVADHLTGEPLSAQVRLLNFTFDTGELPRMSDPLFGRSRWLVTANVTYTAEVSAPGYQSRTLAAPVADEPVDLLVLLLPNGAVLGDFEPDGDIDMRDYYRFHACFGETTAACRVFDFTADEDVTLADYAFLEDALLGPE